MEQCIICGKKLRGQQRRYCSEKCQKKSWKLKNRKKYLLGKKEHREENRLKTLRYLEGWKEDNPKKVKEQRRRRYLRKKWKSKK